MWTRIVKQAFNHDADERSLNQWLTDFSVTDEDFNHHVMPSIGRQHALLEIYVGASITTRLWINE